MKAIDRLVMQDVLFEETEKLMLIQSLTPDEKLYFVEAVRKIHTYKKPAKGEKS